MNAPTTLHAEPELLRRSRESFTLHLSMDGMATMLDMPFDDADMAKAVLCAFRSTRWADKQAYAYLWNQTAGVYVERWCGGVMFGPKDERHPLERVFDRAVRSGAPVTVIDDTRTVRFNLPARLDAVAARREARAA